MIDRQGGQIVFECDSCDETLETGTEEFRDAWAHAQREGWRAKKIGTVWTHACPGCEL